MRNFKPHLLPLYFLLFISHIGSLRADLDEDIICNIMNCGHGTCKINSDSFFGYDCECEHGWKQYPSWIGSLPLPPCVVPNCTIDYDCGVPSWESPWKDVGVAPSSESSWKPREYIGLTRPATATKIFYACLDVICGEGSCVVTNQTEDGFGYRCDCRPGYNNFRNITTAACLDPCSLGGDCSNLVLDVPSPPSAPNHLKKNGSSVERNISSDHLLLAILLFISIFLGWA